MYPPPAHQTSQVELLGTTAGIILTVVVAVVGLAVALGMVYWADSHPGPGPQAGRRRPGGGTGVARPAEISPGQGARPWQRVEDRHVPHGGHPHGRPSSWALVGVVIAAFVTGALALILHVWVLFWVCAGIVVAAIPAGKAVGIMNDTIAWGSTEPTDEPEHGELDPAQQSPGNVRSG